MKPWQEALENWMRKHSTQMGIDEEKLAAAMFKAGQEYEKKTRGVKSALGGS